MKKRLDFNLTINSKQPLEETNIKDNFNKVVTYVSKKVFAFEKNSYFDVSIIDSQQMKDINNTYRHVNKITDVISFALWDNNAIKTQLLGEIFICYQQAEIQASALSHSLTREIVFLLVHGLLHLLQYSHDLPESENEMNLLQKEIMGNIGII